MSNILNLYEDLARRASPELLLAARCCCCCCCSRCCCSPRAGAGGGASGGAGSGGASGGGGGSAAVHRRGARARRAPRARARALIYEKHQSILFKGDCNSSNLLHLPQNFIQQVVAPVCPVILRGRWPQADYFGSRTAGPVRVTTRHIAWSGIYERSLSLSDC